MKDHVFVEIESGKLKGRRMIMTKKQLEEKQMPEIAMVEDGVFPGGIPMFSPHCLVHEISVPSSGCPKCKEVK